MSFQRSLFQYVFDASSLINIERLKKMTELKKRKGDVLIPEKVSQEVNQPNAPLYKFILKYPNMVTQFQNSEEDEYLRIRGDIGIDDGEAAAIAIAFKRNLPLVIDDKKGRAKAQQLGIRILTWDEFFKN